MSASRQAKRNTRRITSTLTLDPKLVGSGVTPIDGNTVVLEADSSVPCFRLGTLILTKTGQVPVERLQIGDLVMTASGALAPVRWIGWREIGSALRPAAPAAWPIVIRAGAIGPNKPQRDLRVSPEHNLVLDRRLVPAKLLVNGASIEIEAVEQISYWHVELDQHDVLIAEGLEAESFLNCDSRHIFANGGAAVTLYADFWAEHPNGGEAFWAKYGCLPRCIDGPDLEAIRAEIAARSSYIEQPPLARLA